MTVTLQMLKAAALKATCALLLLIGLSCTAPAPNNDGTADQSELASFDAPSGSYSVSFPSDLRQHSTGDSLVLRFSTSDPEEEAPTLSFAVDANPDGLSVQAYYDGSPGEDLMGRAEGCFSTTTIGGVESFRFTPVMTFAGETIIIIPQPGQFIRIADNGDAFQPEGLLQSILNELSF